MVAACFSGHLAKASTNLKSLHFQRFKRQEGSSMTCAHKESTDRDMLMHQDIGREWVKPT